MSESPTPGIPTRTRSPRKRTEPSPTRPGGSPEPVPLPQALAEVSADKLAQALQAHLLASTQLMQRFIQSQPADDQAKWKRPLSQLQTTLQMVHKACPSETLPQESLTGDEVLDPARLQEFSQLVISLRSAAGLSRRELSVLSGLSEKTIYNVEEGDTMPTHATVLRLLAVKELGLTTEQVPWQQKSTLDVGSSPNCWIAPGYEPLKLFAELFEVLNGPGGAVEQTFVYLDPQSAINWYELCNQSYYATKYRARLPLDAVAQRALELTGHGRLDVVGLGSGDGKQECRLVEQLLDWADETKRPADLRLYLLDVSQPLLSAAYQHAAQTLGRRRSVSVQAIQGNFHHWPRYTQLHHAAERGNRRRLISLIGGTIGNLENEARFFQHTLVGLAPDDLLLLDVLIAAADPQNPDEIRRKDPALSSGPSAEHRKWLTGPLLRYCQDLESVELKYALGGPCTVPGSYAIDVIATVELRDRQSRRFALHRFKRYDPKRLADMMRHLGWALEAEVPYGPDPSSPAASAMLFRKLAPSLPGVIR